jgi:hypothetical protein
VTKYRFNPQPDITAYELAVILQKTFVESLGTVTVDYSEEEHFREFARHFERKD